VLFFVLEILRTHLEVSTMLLYLTAAVSVFLFVYLGVAMIRPEWF
jgi:K+-transporting ATPase KdpF subunit